MAIIGRVWTGGPHIFLGTLDTNHGSLYHRTNTTKRYTEFCNANFHELNYTITLQEIACPNTKP